MYQFTSFALSILYIQIEIVLVFEDHDVAEPHDLDLVLHLGLCNRVQEALPVGARRGARRVRPTGILIRPHSLHA